MPLICNNRIKTAVVFIFLIIFCFKSGFCSELCRKGDIYKDPKSRFEVICPADKMDVDNYGVYFKDEPNFSFYLVRAYDAPPLRPNATLSISNVLSDIKSMMASQSKIDVLKEEVSTYQSHESVNFDFIYQQEKPIYYYTRLIKTANFVLWIYLSMPSGPEAVIVTNEGEATKASDIANKFFDSLRL